MSLQGTYTYDAQGQRTTSVVGPPGGLITTTEYAYQGLLLQSLSASQTGTGATTWKITYLYDEYGRPYGGVYRSPATSTSPVFFGMVTTDRGDVVELLDASGTPFAAYRYDAWGNPQGTGNVTTGIWSQSTTLITSQVASAIAQRQVLRYASYCFDSKSGMYYLALGHNILYYGTKAVFDALAATTMALGMPSGLGVVGGALIEGAGVYLTGEIIGEPGAQQQIDGAHEGVKISMDGLVNYGLGTIEGLNPWISPVLSILNGIRD